MKNLMNFKSFEANQIGMTPLVTSMEDLTNYYKCNKCNSLFKNFNDVSTQCKSCGSNDIENISDFDYVTLVKQKSELGEFENELKDKNNRGNQLVDLVDVGYQKNLDKYKKNIN